MPVLYWFCAQNATGGRVDRNFVENAGPPAPLAFAASGDAEGYKCETRLAYDEADD